jgi:hypothetical protein
MCFTQAGLHVTVLSRTAIQAPGGWASDREPAKRSCVRPPETRGPTVFASGTSEAGERPSLRNTKVATDFSGAPPSICEGGFFRVAHALGPPPSVLSRTGSDRPKRTPGRGAKPAASSSWGTREFLGAQLEMAMPLCRLSEAAVVQHRAALAVLFPKAALT